MAKDHAHKDAGSRDAAKEKRINELSGISGISVVQLTRIGIVTVADLLAADFDRVAYVLEDYKEATRLVAEAQRLVKGKRSSASESRTPKATEGHGVEHVVPPKPGALEAEARAELGKSESSRSEPVRPEQGRGEVARSGGKAGSSAGSASGGVATPVPAGCTTTETPLGLALSLVARGVSLAAQDDEARLSLARRLSTADLLLRYNGGEHELIAALLTEPVEAGLLAPQEALARFGPEVWHVLEEVTALRAVPLMPSGRPPKHYMDMAREAGATARRVCAAFLAQSLGSGSSASSNLLHARLLIEALRLGGPDELVELASATLEHASADAQARLAA